MTPEEMNTILSGYPRLLELVKLSVKDCPLKGTLHLPSTWNKKEEMRQLERALNHHFAPFYIFYIFKHQLGWHKKSIPLPYRNLLVRPGRETTAPGFDKTCPLCSKPYARGDVLAQLKNCSHASHINCLAKHFKSSDTCPSCG